MSGAMVVPEIICLVQGYSTVRIKDLSIKKKERYFFGALKRKSSSGQLSQGEDVCPGSTPPPSDTSSLHHDRLDMVPGGRGGEVALSAQQCAAEILIATPGSSKARQKKFHRHFKTVAQDERVLNYYSCALVADILLQGHLYITKNYFAFYSNVFGYVTKLLIPTSTVLKVTKEKTAYIIPNAVGITTEDDKHVFGSLLSRDSTYKLMVQVWTAAMKPTPIHLPIPSARECMDKGIKEDLVEDCPDIPILNDEESSLSGSESNLDSKLTNTSMDTKSGKHPLGVEVKSYHDMFSQTVPTKHSYAQCYSFLSTIPRPTILLFISTILLLVLFTSAAILLFRVARLQQGYSNDAYFSTRSISEVQEFLDSNLEQISKVRQSLETLSLLIEGGGNELGRRKWNHLSNNNENFHQHNS